MAALKGAYCLIAIFFMTNLVLSADLSRPPQNGITCQSVLRPSPAVSSVLGKGRWGVVYLREDKNGNQFAEKKYQSPQQATHDFRALEYLRHKWPAMPPLVIVKSEMIDRLTLKLDYVNGRTVQDVANDIRHSKEYRDEIMSNYNLVVRRLMDLLKDEGFAIDFIKSPLVRGSAYDDSFGFGPLNFVFHPDNFIVDLNSNTITLIDPS